MRFDGGKHRRDGITAPSLQGPCVFGHGASSWVRDGGMTPDGEDDAERKQGPERLHQALELGRSLARWCPPDLKARCPLEECRMPLADENALALHLVMAAGDNHLAWKRRNLSAVHRLDNTKALVREALAIVQAEQGR